MAIELVLNPRAPGYEQFQQDLREEFGAFRKLKYREVKSAPPANTLSIEEDVLRFIFEPDPGKILLIRTIFEIVRAIIQRRKASVEPKNPPCIIVVDGKSLSLPSIEGSEKGFLRRAAKPTSTPRKGKKKGSKRRTNRRQ